MSNGLGGPRYFCGLYVGWALPTTLFEHLSTTRRPIASSLGDVMKGMSDGVHRTREPAIKNQFEVDWVILTPELEL